MQKLKGEQLYYIEKKLIKIEEAMRSYEGDDSIYARRKMLKLNQLAAKLEALLNIK